MWAESPDSQPVDNYPWARSLHADRSSTNWSEIDQRITIHLDSDDNSAVDLRGSPSNQVVIKVKGNTYNSDSPTVPERWEVHLPPSTSSIAIQVKGGTQARISLLGGIGRLNVHVSTNGRGQACVDLQQTAISTMTVLQTRVILGRLRRADLSSLQIEESQVDLTDRTVNQIGIQGKCAIELVRSNVGVLTTRGHAQLRIRTHSCRVGTVTSINNGQNIVFLHDSNVDVDRIKQAQVIVTKDAELRIFQAIRELTLKGPGSIGFHQSAQQLTFSAPAPKVSIANHVQLVDVVGTVRLGAVAGASIVGRPAQRNGLDSSRLVLAEVASTPDELNGVTITDVVIPESLIGLQIMAQLQASAHHVTPAIHNDLPGLGRLSGWRLSAFRRPQVDRSALLISAQYAKAISDLASSLGAPASVRTQLAWCAYRMRMAVAPGRIERILLGLYRLIGYGERVPPAAVCYIALAMIANTISMRHNSVELTSNGVEHWIRGFLDWLVSPLHILNFTGDRGVSEHSLTQPWDTLTRLIVAVPFATAALALRKYVKSTDKT